MINQLNHYQALGLSQNASASEIKAAYKALALQFHPDKNTDKTTATVIFNRVNEAYQTLINQDSRIAYDRHLLFMSNSSQAFPPRSSTAFEEYKHFKTFMNCVFNNEIPRDDEYFEMKSYFNNNLVGAALDNMRTFTERCIFDQEDQKEFPIKESKLGRLSRKISKQEKPVVKITKKSKAKAAC